MINTHPRNIVLCRKLMDCVRCVSQKCAWIGEGSHIPCRNSKFDIEDEAVQFPLPRLPEQCKRIPAGKISTDVLQWQVDEQDSSWHLTLLIALLLCALVLAFGLLWRFRRHSLRRHVFSNLEEHEMEYIEGDKENFP